MVQVLCLYLLSYIVIERIELGFSDIVTSSVLKTLPDMVEFHEDILRE